MTEPSSFRDVVRTVTVSYPVPFLLAALLAFTLGCFGLGLIAHGWAAAAILVTGCMAAICACVIGGYSVLRRPDLLRSERFSLMIRYFDALSDSEMDTDARERLGKVIDGFAEPSVPKRTLNRPAGSAQPRTENDG